MGTEAPTPIVIPVHSRTQGRPRVPSAASEVGEKAPSLLRRVRTVAYKAVAYLEITYGEYAARCECSTTFRNTHEDVLPRAAYDNKVRDLVLDRILKDGMSVERTLRSLQREFLLDLSSGFAVYDVLRDASRRTRPGDSSPQGPGALPAAHSASMSCTSDASPCCWPPTP